MLPVNENYASLTIRLFKQVHAVHSPLPQNCAATPALSPETRARGGFSCDSLRAIGTHNESAFGLSSVNILQMSLLTGAFKHPALGITMGSGRDKFFS